MPYADVVHRALYDPVHGFYSVGGRAGRRGDFLTSPEVGPLFGHVVARAIDAEWERLGRPDEFTFVDFGAGPGTLARSVFAASPAVGEQLTYIAVERSAAQRENHPDGVLSVEGLAVEHVGTGICGMVFANELLDNLPFTPVRWEVDRATFASVTIGADGELAETFEGLSDVDGPPLFPGRTVVDQSAAAAWVSWILRDVIDEGRLVIIDYARQKTEDVEVRTYSEHGLAGDPLVALGAKDITVDVDLEVLQRSVRDAERIVEQREWLRLHGVDALVEQGRTIWEEQASIGDLAALRAKSRIREAEALSDPAGLGGFWVLEWTV